MSVADAAPEATAVERQVQRLLVSRQDDAGVYQPMGFLDARPTSEGIEYGFAYLRSVADAVGFRPMLGFREPRRYTSMGLFPLFAERLMDPRRPDHPEFLAALDLAADASPLTILERSAGHRIGDRIELSTVPRVDVEGATSCVFLVHGVRHIEGAAERIAELHDGDQLGLQPQPQNPVNPEALHVTVAGRHGQPLGWVPNVLLDYVHHLGAVSVRALRVNGPEVGPRLRLLVRLAGRSEPGWSPFVGPAWVTAD